MRWPLVALALAAAGAACGDNLRPIPSCRTWAASDAGVAPAAAPGYDDYVLATMPVGYYAMRAGGPTERDLAGSATDGTYSGAPGLALLPDGELAADFHGDTHLTVPSPASGAFSIRTTGALTWEAWIRPDALADPYPGDYVNWLSKCADFAPTCEWEARFYDEDSARCNRFSAYAFNPSAGLGAGAFWQPECGALRECAWHHVVGEYTLAAQPADCPDAAEFPGSIAIWVDGVPWDQAAHAPTGCMSELGVVPASGDSPLVIGGGGFDGAIGKVALYDALLTQEQIAIHYHAMTGEMPTGSCADTCRE